MLKELTASHSLILITKGDLLDQHTKVERSGLHGYFQSIEVVHKKEGNTYRSILERYKVHPSQFMMAGNSLRSDILPVLEIGGYAVYIPCHLTWAHESQVDYPVYRGTSEGGDDGSIPDVSAFPSVSLCPFL